MDVREKLDHVLAALPPNRVFEVLDFARYVLWLEHRYAEEEAAWTRFRPGQWDELYGPDEPEYTEADLKPELNP